MADLPSNMSYCYIKGQLVSAVTDGPDAGHEPDAVPRVGLQIMVRTLLSPRVVTNKDADQEIDMSDIYGQTDSAGQFSDTFGNKFIGIVAPDPDLLPSVWKVTVTISDPNKGGYTTRSKTFVPIANTPETALDWTDILEVTPSPGVELEAWQALQGELLSARDVTLAARDQTLAFAGTNNQQVAVMVTNPGPTKDAVADTVAAAVVPSVNQYLADNPTVIEAVAELAQSDAGLLRVDLLDPETPRNRWDLSFPGGETFLTFEEIPDESPYLTWVKYNTGEFQSYVKKNGDVYPPVESPPVTPTTLTAYVVGDSIAANWASHFTGLAAATGRVVSGEAIGGQRSYSIAARQGGVPALLTVPGNSIPASGSVTPTSIVEFIGNGVATPLATPNDATVTRTYVVGGTRCLLTGVNVGGATTYSIAQIGGVSAIPCPPGTPMVPLDRPAGTLTILAGPRNDVSPLDDGFRSRCSLEQILARYDRMIRRAKRNGGAVILLPVLAHSGETATGSANRILLNNALRDLAPQDWADWQAWLQSDQAFTAAGVTKTSQDSADIANGFTPSSFRVDEVHPSAAGYAASNRFIELVRISRGI